MINSNFRSQIPLQTENSPCVFITTDCTKSKRIDDWPSLVINTQQYLRHIKRVSGLVEYKIFDFTPAMSASDASTAHRILPSSLFVLIFLHLTCNGLQGVMMTECHVRRPLARYVAR